MPSNEIFSNETFDNMGGRSRSIKNDSGLTVTGDKVLIAPMVVEEKTSGGIVLPAMSLEKEQLAQQMGVLLAMGSVAVGAPELEGIAVGDVVLFPRYRGQDYPVDGVRYWIMYAKDILGRCDKLPDSVIRGARSSVEVFGINEQKVA